MNKTLKNLNSLIFKCVASLCHPFPSSHSLTFPYCTHTAPHIPSLLYVPLVISQFCPSPSCQIFKSQLSEALFPYAANALPRDGRV